MFTVQPEIKTVYAITMSVLHILFCSFSHVSGIGRLSGEW